MSMTLTMHDGAILNVERMFGGDRALVWLEPGVPVLAVLTGHGWDTDTGEPCRPGEEENLYNALLKGAGTTVTVTDPDGGTTVYEDPS